MYDLQCHYHKCCLRHLTRLMQRVCGHMQGVPAIAVSLDNYKALTPEGFMAGAAYVVAFVKVIFQAPA